MDRPSLRACFAPTCKSDAFVIDGRLACCDRKAQDSNSRGYKVEVDTTGSKRKRPSKTEQARLLEAQNNRCFYCGDEFGSFRLISGADIFLRFAEAKVYLKLKLHEKKTEIRSEKVPELRAGLPAKEEVAEVLHPGVSEGKVGNTAPKNRPNKTRRRTDGQINCSYCETPFKPRRSHTKYCSPNCRWMAWHERHPRTPSPMPFDYTKPPSPMPFDYTKPLTERTPL